MKWTLKNRPHLEGKSTLEQFIKYHGENEEWFEGFEKRLRVFVRDCCEKCNMVDDCSVVTCEALRKIKEILGE